MEKIKPYITSCIASEKGKDIFIVLIVILVGLGSFELGRLSKDSASSGIKINYADKNMMPLQNQGASVILSEQSENPTQTGSTTASQNPKSTGNSFFASSRGTKFYPLGCSAGKSLKQENRIYFATGEEAQRAGYELSASCK